MKSRLNRGLDPNLYFFRDAQGHELDFVFKSGHELIPIEAKSSETFNRSLLKNLDFFSNLLPERVPRGFLVYGGSTEQAIGAYEVLNYKSSGQYVR